MHRQKRLALFSTFGHTQALIGLMRESVLKSKVKLSLDEIQGVNR